MAEKVPSIGVAAYVAIGTVTTFTELCTLGVSGGGAEASVVELEPCLNETEVTQTVDLPKNKTITVQYKKEAGASGLSQLLHAATKARTTVKLAIKYPLSTVIYGRRDGYITDHDDDGTSRPNHLACTMTVIPTGDWTYSTTAPAT